jgi:chromosome segregation ATPase
MSDPLIPSFSQMPSQPPKGGFWERQGVYVGVAGIGAAILMGLFSFWQAAEISKVSDVAASLTSISGDVRATNTRIDQVFPLITQQANDIGSIKGDLRAATDKITVAATQSEQLSNRLTAIVDKQAALAGEQNAQIETIKEIKGSIAKLIDTVGGQRDELIKIVDQIGPHNRLPPKD